MKTITERAQHRTNIARHHSSIISQVPYLPETWDWFGGWLASRDGGAHWIWELLTTSAIVRPSFLFSARIMLFSSKKCDCPFITGNHSAAVTRLRSQVYVCHFNWRQWSFVLPDKHCWAFHATSQLHVGIETVSSDHLNFKADVHEFLWSFRRFPKFYSAFKKTDLWRSRHKSRHYRPEVAYHKTINNKQGYW